MYGMGFFLGGCISLAGFQDEFMKRGPNSPMLPPRWWGAVAQLVECRTRNRESPLLPFQSLGIFFHFTTPQSTQLYK